MKKYLQILLVLFFCATVLDAQIKFSKITDVANPLATIPPQAFYNGCSWIDYDNDGKMDLYVVRTGLYHNDGNGMFTQIVGNGLSVAGGVGNTWADYDNDGYIDCLVSGGNAFGSRLFKNNGNGTFTQNINAAFAVPTQLRGWGSSFGDFNRDGFIDIAIASPFGFVAISDPSKILKNNGTGNFEQVSLPPITDSIDSYTVPTWSDFDGDGDVDLFIGSGRVNGSLFQDYAMENKTAVGGLPNFKRITKGPLGIDGHDGQVWNWIDYDNDGDLDLYITNYAGTGTNGFPNDLYRNDEGKFKKMKATDVGTIVSDSAISLASVWNDYDNDGDLDCIVINEGGSPNFYYQNNTSRNGKNFFVRITKNIPFIEPTGNVHFTATGADYDNDGDIDIFLSGLGNDRGLYKNDLNNGNKWINIKLIGTVSNKSAIGAKVRIKTKIDGKEVWQLREISAQNTFNGMNMLNAHFGLNTSNRIDEIVIEWPSGRKSKYKHLNANQFYTYTEANGNEDDEDGGEENKFVTSQYQKSIADGKSEEIITSIKVSSYPNPTTGKSLIEYALPADARVSLKIYNSTGIVVKMLVSTKQQSGVYRVSFNEDGRLPAGVYTYKLSINAIVKSGRIVVVK